MLENITSDFPDARVIGWTLKVVEMFWILSRVADSRDDLKCTYNADLSNSAFQGSEVSTHLWG